MSHIIRTSITETVTCTKDFTLAEFLDMGGLPENFTPDNIMSLMDGYFADSAGIGDTIREIVTAQPAEYDGDPEYFAEERDLSDNPDDFTQPRQAGGGKWYEGRS